MVMLDADIAGCVDAWLGSKGRLDEQRQEWLQSCLDDLRRVVSVLDDPEERAYFERLHALARLALA
jgi:hypothetical protein